MTDIQHQDGKFFINGEPVSTTLVYRQIKRLIEDNAQLRKEIQKLIYESDDGEEM